MDWEKVLFSDESTFQQFNPKKKHVRRPIGKRFDQRYTVQTMKHPQSQMIWSAIYFVENNTINSEKYLAMLKDKLNIHMNVYQCNVFTQDGAPCHRTKKVTEYLNSEKIEILQRPGNSPDLNPIENLWSIMKDEVAEKMPSNANEMTEAIKQVWVREIPQEYCKSLTNSMPKRLAAVIQNGGSHNKY